MHGIIYVHDRYGDLELDLDLKFAQELTRVTFSHHSPQCPLSLFGQQSVLACPMREGQDQYVGYLRGGNLSFVCFIA